MTYLSHYDWNEGTVSTVHEVPTDYQYTLKYEPLRSEHDNSVCGGLVTLIDYAKGIKTWEYIPMEELEYFESANVAADLCHRAGFCLERPARYAFDCIESPKIMFITKHKTEAEKLNEKWEYES